MREFNHDGREDALGREKKELIGRTKAEKRNIRTLHLS